MTRCLVLSHAFNMDGRAASQTITDKIPYLEKLGFSLYVLSAITGVKDVTVFHQQLISWGPSAFKFDLRHWLALRWGRGWLYKLVGGLVGIILFPFIIIEKLLVGLSNQWSWTIPSLIYGLRLIKSKKIDVIYSTGGAWSAHLTGLLLKKMTGKCWLVEIHDPLVVRHHRGDVGLGSRQSKDARLQAWLEKQIAHHADLVWWFTKGAFDFAKQRHYQFETNGFYVLPGSEPFAIKGHHDYQDVFTINHFGSLSASRSLEPFLKALPAFFDRFPESKKYLRINVYGSKLDVKSKECIEGLHLSEHVIVHGRVERDAKSSLSGREKICQYMQASDFLLLLHGEFEGCSEYIPSKLYEYWWANRPILGVTYLNEQLDGLLADINQTPALTAHTNEPKSIVLALAEAWNRWLKKEAFSVGRVPVNVNVAVEEIVHRYQQKNMETIF